MLKSSFLGNLRLERSTLMLLFQITVGIVRYIGGKFKPRRSWNLPVTVKPVDNAETVCQLAVAKHTF